MANDDIMTDTQSDNTPDVADNVNTASPTVTAEPEAEDKAAVVPPVNVKAPEGVIAQEYHQPSHRYLGCLEYGALRFRRLRLEV